MLAASWAPLSSGRRLPDEGSGSIAIVPPVAITAVGRGAVAVALSWSALAIACAAANGTRWRASLCCPSVTESLWDVTAEQLLARTASADPTPGGGAIAALVGAFGAGLVQMALAVTIQTADEAARTQLEATQTRAHRLRGSLAQGADRDVEAFDLLMRGYRLPRDSEAQRIERARTVADLTASAAGHALWIGDHCAAGIDLADEAEALVKASIVSDVLAGRDLLRGAGLAALRTADVNIAALESSAAPERHELHDRRAVLIARLSEGGAPA